MDIKDTPDLTTCQLFLNSFKTINNIPNKVFILVYILPGISETIEKNWNTVRDIGLHRKGFSFSFDKGLFSRALIKKVFSIISFWNSS